jgi:hypothetical protein
LFALLNTGLVISWSLVVSQPCHCYAASLLKTNPHVGHLQGLLLGLFLGLALGQGHALYQGINTCLLNCCVSILTFLLTCILFLVYVREGGGSNTHEDACYSSFL